MVLPPELVKLRDVVGEEALRSLRSARHTVLRIWRRSTPHNWWVENRRGTMLWHSCEEDRLRPDLRLFDLVEHSEQPIIYPGRMRCSDHGSPEESRYRLKAEYCTGKRSS